MRCDDDKDLHNVPVLLDLLPVQNPVLQHQLVQDLPEFDLSLLPEEVEVQSSVDGFILLLMKLLIQSLRRVF